MAKLWWWPFGRVPEISDAKLRERIERGDDVQLVDVVVDIKEECRGELGCD